MILIENPERFAEFQEVDGFNLLEETGHGWVIIAVLNTQQIESRQVQVPYKDPNGYHQSAYQDEVFVVAKPKYLLGKTRDQVIEELRTDLKAAKDTKDHHEARARSLDTMVKDLGADICRQNEMAGKAEEDANKLKESMRGMSTSKLKMEGDIAKLRTALGEIKFKEILGVPEEVS